MVQQNFQQTRMKQVLSFCLGVGWVLREKRGDDWIGSSGSSSSGGGGGSNRLKLIDGFNE